VETARSAPIKPSTAARLVRRAVLALALVCMLVWTGSVGCLWLNESRIVFRTEASLRRSRPLDPAVFAPLTLTTRDGVRLEAVQLDAGELESRYWILFCHGAANSIHSGRVQDQLEALHSLGYNVLAFSFRGFGRTAGIPTEAGLYEDALAAYTYLTATRTVPADHVILGGRSLGSAVAVELATRVATAGLVLFSPIDSVAGVGGRLYPWVPIRLLASNQFDSFAKVERVRTPVLVVHSMTDRLVPLASARALFGKVTGPKRMLETGGGHNNAGFTALSELSDALAAFWPPGAAVVSVQ
jgi:pimeloyl-ACP methyl ester carboxylesterase